MICFWVWSHPHRLSRYVDFVKSLAIISCSLDPKLAPKTQDLKFSSSSLWKTYYDKGLLETLKQNRLVYSFYCQLSMWCVDKILHILKQTFCLLISGIGSFHVCWYWKIYLAPVRQYKEKIIWFFGDLKVVQFLHHTWNMLFFPACQVCYLRCLFCFPYASFFSKPLNKWLNQENLLCWVSAVAKLMLIITVVNCMQKNIHIIVF